MPIQAHDDTRPFRLLYLSTVDVYDCQWHVTEAVAALRRRGSPVTIDFVGAAYTPALACLGAAIDHLDPDCQALRHRGPTLHADLPEVYRAADAFVFASACMRDNAQPAARRDGIRPASHGL